MTPTDKFVLPYDLLLNQAKETVTETTMAAAVLSLRVIVKLDDESQQEQAVGEVVGGLAVYKIAGGGLLLSPVDNGLG